MAHRIRVCEEIWLFSNSSFANFVSALLVVGLPDRRLFGLGGCCVGWTLAVRFRFCFFLIRTPSLR
jgi:hypothetical protein